jgi:hypothetical protein
VSLCAIDDERAAELCYWAIVVRSVYLAALLKRKIITLPALRDQGMCVVEALEAILIQRQATALLHHPAGAV